MILFDTSFTRNKNVVSIFVHRKQYKTLCGPFAGVKIGEQVEIAYSKNGLYEFKSAYVRRTQEIGYYAPQPKQTKPPCVIIDNVRR